MMTKSIAEWMFSFNYDYLRHNVIDLWCLRVPYAHETKCFTIDQTTAKKAARFWKSLWPNGRSFTAVSSWSKKTFIFDWPAKMYKNIFFPMNSIMRWNLTSKKFHTETEYGVWKLLSCRFIYQSEKRIQFRSPWIIKKKFRPILDQNILG